MAQVLTSKGMMDSSQLERCLEFKENENAVVVAVSWKLNGEEIKRAVVAVPLRPLEFNGESQAIG